MFRIFAPKVGRVLVRNAIPVLLVGAAALASAHAEPPVFLALGSGERHSCGVLSDGKVVCWGADDLGQLGDGDATSEDRSIAVQVTGIRTAVDIAVGGDFSCALLADHSLRCWGFGALGQLGEGPFTTRYAPVVVQGISDAVDVAAGRYHACAVRAGGAVACWGYNVDGQLGNGTRTASGVAVAVSSLSTATAVAAGEGHTCARRTDGTAVCWGSNGFGQLGNGSTTTSLVPVAVNTLNDVEEVALGRVHSCARRASGVVICWGYDYYGQLGDGAILYRTSTQRSQPTFNVVGISTARAIASGLDHSCATLVGGEMRCWGRNDSGMLGNGGYDDTSTPVSVTSLVNADRPAVGKDHSCALSSSGRASCWGSNFYGQLGDDSRVTHDLSTTRDSAIPVVVSGPTFNDLDAGWRTGCGVRRDGSVWCWGDSFWSTPIAFGSDGFGLDVGAGSEHACVVLDDATVQCRGANGSGQLGDGTTTDSYFVPVDVVGIASATAVDAQEGHSCALLSGGGVECWGSNEFGQLGNGTTVDSPLPVVVGGLPTAVGVATGSGHSCAATDTGAVYCWGLNSSGELGGGTMEVFSSTPIAVPAVSNALSVSAGTRHTCSRLGDGGVRCWGGNDFGQVGSGSIGMSSPPVAPLGLSSAQEITAGGEHSCALLAAGGIRCWGRNDFGQLGNGTRDGSATPIAVSGTTGARTVRAGRSQTCAGLEKSLPWEVSMRCWGRALWGALGNDYRSGDPVDELTPVPVVESFTPIRFRLTVEKRGDGTGRLTTLHPGIDCGSDCSEDLAIGSTARLVATADPPFALYAWRGDADCSDGVVTLDADRDCVALIPEPDGRVMLLIGSMALLFRARGSRLALRPYGRKNRRALS